MQKMKNSIARRAERRDGCVKNMEAMMAAWRTVSIIIPAMATPLFSVATALCAVHIDITFKVCRSIKTELNLKTVQN